MRFVPLLLTLNVDLIGNLLILRPPSNSNGRQNGSNIARVPHKGHAVLAEAATLLAGVDIGVAGEGPLVYPGLRWLGQRSDVPPLLAAAGVFFQKNKNVPGLWRGM